MQTIATENIPMEARRFLDRCDLSQGEVVLEQNGVPHIILSSPKLLEQRRQAKAQLLELIDQIHRRNPHLDSDALLLELEANGDTETKVSP